MIFLNSLPIAVIVAIILAVVAPDFLKMNTKGDKATFPEKVLAFIVIAVILTFIIPIALLILNIRFNWFDLS